MIRPCLDVSGPELYRTFTSPAVLRLYNLALLHDPRAFSLKGWADYLGLAAPWPPHLASYVGQPLTREALLLNFLTH